VPGRRRTLADASLTGRYARTIGAGRVQLSEDAAKHHRMTVIGAIAG